MTDRACKNCVFWRIAAGLHHDTNDITKGVVLGLCRRFPPSRRPLQEFPFSRHPVTDGDYWCGEFHHVQAVR